MLRFDSIRRGPALSAMCNKTDKEKRAGLPTSCAPGRFRHVPVRGEESYRSRLLLTQPVPNLKHKFLDGVRALHQ
jgi:hypothetical protein